MSRFMATIVGADRSGIVHSVSSVLLEHGCALSDVTQTTLQGQFAGLFSFVSPEGPDSASLASGIKGSLEDKGLACWVTPIEGAAPPPVSGSEPYVMTLTAPDSPRLVATVAGALASFDVNIDNLRSLALSPPEGQLSAPGPVVLVLEITVPEAVSQKAFRQSLALAAEELGTEISLQHRDIFEAIHRV
jgi:glycine cleavage system transcriptional repressor